MRPGGRPSGGTTSVSGARPGVSTTLTMAWSPPPALDPLVRVVYDLTEEIAVVTVPATIVLPILFNAGGGTSAFRAGS